MCIRLISLKHLFPIIKKINSKPTFSFCINLNQEVYLDENKNNGTNSIPVHDDSVKEKILEVLQK